MRREFSAKVTDAAFARCGGHCEGCSAPLRPGKIEYDHILSDGLGGGPTLDNCQVLCTACHSLKTHHSDRPKMAKADRGRKKHFGKRQSSHPIPGSKASGLRKRMDGTVEPRQPNRSR